ncbi:MAG: calcium-binding protein [Cyanobacteria bacterium P01_F01_bin.153]
MTEPNIAIALLNGGLIPDGTTNTINFPTVISGVPQSLDFLFFNGGNNNLVISDISLPPGFSLDPTFATQLRDRPFLLAPNQRSVIPVTVFRITVGDIGGNFVVQSNDPDTTFYNFPIAATVIPSGAGSVDTSAIISLVTELGTPAPGTVANQIADGPLSSRLEGVQANDLITAGQGNDLVFGFGGNDYLFGGMGNDTILGGAGNDSLSGDFGDDFLFAGPGQDLLIGRSGVDVINGNQGNDTLGGGEGNDILFGGKNEDVLAGGVGNDILFGDLGNDTLLGGVDVDQYAIAANGGTDVILDYEDGTDKFLLVGGLTFDAIRLVGTSTGATINVGDTVLASVLNVTLSQLDSSDFLVLGA